MQSLAFDLADALSGDTKVLTGLCHRVGFAMIVEPESHRYNLGFPLGKRAQYSTDCFAQACYIGIVQIVGSLDQQAELRVLPG